MKTGIIPISVRTENAGTHSPFIKYYIPDTNEEMAFQDNRPAIVILPGGAYEYCSFREDEPVALRFASEGFPCFVLEYSVGIAPKGELPAHYPQALCEAAQTVSIVREHSKEWGINPNRIFVMGFSAGGHLAASLATLYGSNEVMSNLGGTENMYRPDGMILCYPVISHNIMTHDESFRALLGEQYSQEMLNLVSLETKVTENTPPAYIWTTETDELVPYENSVVMKEALENKGVYVKFDLFNEGEHGLSLCNRNVKTPEKECSVWISNAVDFILRG